MGRSAALLVTAVLAGRGIVLAQPPAPVSVNVTSSDNSLIVSWPPVISGGDPVRGYLVTVDPVSMPRIPTLSPAFGDEFNSGSLDTNMWTVVSGPCSFTTLWPAPCASGAALSSVSMAAVPGSLSVSVPAGMGSWPLPTFSTVRQLNNTGAFAWGNNGAPILTRNMGFVGLRDYANVSQTYFTRVTVSDSGGDANLTRAGFVVYDTPGGGAPRQLLQFHLTANSVAAGNQNRVSMRALNGAAPGTPSNPTVGADTTLNSVGVPGIISVELYLQRDAEAGKWTLGYRWPNQAFPVFTAAVVADTTVSAGGWNPSTAFVGLFVDNPGQMDRSASFDSFVVYSRQDWAFYAGNVSASLSRNATIASRGICAVARTVTRTVPAESSTVVVNSLQNGNQYTVTVASLGTVFTSAATVAPGVYAPTPVLPSLSVPVAPALFLDAMSLPFGGGALERWRDVSGNGRDFVQYTQGLMPVAPNPTAFDPAPYVFFPTSTATEMVQEAPDSFFDMGADVQATSAHEMSAFVLYQPDTQSYYSMSILSKGRTGKAGWEIVAMYSGNTNFGGFRLYGENMDFPLQPVTAPSPFTRSLNSIGLSRTWGVVINPDSFAPTVLTYDYWRRDPVLPIYQLDGCVGINFGNASDYCNNPAGDNTLPSSWSSAGTSTPSQSVWQIGFNYDRGWGPRFPYMTNNVVTWPSTGFTSSGERMKISDGFYANQGTSSYNQNWLQGKLHAVMLYKPRLASRRDRQAVQEYLLDRYGQRCPPNVNPSVNSTCTRFLAAGSSCVHRCFNGTVRIAGPSVSVPALSATLTCANGVYSGKALVCGAQCRDIPGPSNVASCRKAFVSEQWGMYNGNVTSVFDLAQYTTDPALPASTTNRRWFFSAGSLMASVPTRDDACSATTPTTLLTSAPAWADPASAPADPVIHEATFSLESTTARAGVAFRTSANGPNGNMYRFSIRVGTPGGLFEKVTGTGATFATVAINTTLWAFTPVRGTVYRLACSVRATGDIACTAGLAADPSSMLPAYTGTDSDLAFGGGGLYVENGIVAFRNWTVTGGCGNLGQCRGTAGQQCLYTCASGYSLGPGSSGTQTCSANGTYAEGGLIECLPTPPQLPGGQVFPLPENAPMGTILGKLNGSAYNPGDVLLWEILPEGNTAVQKDDLGNVIGNVTGVFGVTLCAGELFLAKAGALSFAWQQFYTLNLRARVASNPRVTALLQLTVSVEYVRQPPQFVAENGNNRRYSRSVAENSPAGTAVGSQLFTRRSDGSQVVSYSIIFGNDMGHFAINNATGQITVARAAVNFEAVPTYQLMVSAFDAAMPEQASTVLVDVNVVDVNDPPRVVPQLLYITETDVRNVGALVDTVVAVDEDAGDALTFAILPGGNGTLFDIGSNNGSLTVRVPPVVSNTSIVNGGVPPRQCRTSLFVFMSVTDQLGGVTVTFNVTVWVTVSEQAVVPGLNPAPQLGSLVPPVTGLFNTSGGNVFTVIGANYFPEYAPFRVAFTAGTGTAARYYIGGDCSVADAPINSQLSCPSPAGYGLNMLAVLVYGPRINGFAAPPFNFYNGSVAAGSAQARFGVPVITEVFTNETSTTDLRNLTTRGSQWVFVRVANMVDPRWAPRGTAPATFINLKYGTGSLAASMQYPTATTQYTPSAAMATRLHVDYAAGLVWFKTVVGVGGPHSIRLVLGDQNVVTNASLGHPTISYGRPVITDILRNVSVVAVASLINYDALLSRTTGSTFHVVGSNFGPTGTVQGILGSNQSLVLEGGLPVPVFFQWRFSCTVTLAHIRMQCTTPQGSGAGHLFAVQVGGQDSEPFPSRTFSYLPPTVTGIGGVGAANADTTGGQVVTFSGRDFGPITWAAGFPGAQTLSPIYARYGLPTDDNTTLWNATRCTVASFTAANGAGTVNCFTGPGSGRGLTWRMWLSGRWVQINTTTTTSYAAPVVSDFQVVTPGNPSTSADFDTRGASLGASGAAPQEVDIVGRNFGPELRSFSASYSMDLLSLDTEWAAVKLRGNAVGANVSATTLTYNATECYLVEPHLRIRCKLSEGVGSGAEWQLSINGQTSSTPTMGHKAPEIWYVRNGTGDWSQGVSQASTDGEDVLLLVGQFFGPGANRNINCRGGAPLYVPNVVPQLRRCWGYVQSIRFGRTGYEYLVDQNFAVVNDTHMYVTLPAGFGEALKFTVTIADQESLPSAENFTYAKPYLTAVSPTLVNTNVNLPDDGGATYTLVRVSGYNLGLLDPSQAQGVYIGNPDDPRSSTAMLSPVNVYPAPSQWSAYRAARPKPAQWVEVLVPQGMLAGRAVRVAVFPLGNPEADSAMITDPTDTTFVPFGRSFLNYRNPTSSSIVFSTAEDSDEVNDFIDQFVQPDAGQAVYKITINGANFGPNAIVTGGDSIARVLEYWPFGVGGATSGLEPNNATIKVYTWTHNRIEGYTTAPNGTVRAAVYGQYWNGTDGLGYATVTRDYRNLSPAVRGWGDGNRGPFPTTGANDDGSPIFIRLNITQLETMNSLSIAVSGLPCPLYRYDVSSTDFIGKELPTDGATLRDLLNDPNPANPYRWQVGTVTWWTIPCRLPPGQGSAAPLVVTRGTDVSPNFAIRYALPLITRVEVYDDDFSAPVVYSVDPASTSLTTVFIPTEPTRVVMYGANFGLTPMVAPGTTSRTNPTVRLQMCNPAADPSGSSNASGTLPFYCTAAVTQSASVASFTMLDFVTVLGTGTGVSGTNVNGRVLDVTVGNQRPTNPVLFRFKAPSLRNWTMVGSTAGGTEFSIIGKNLGGPLGSSNLTLSQPIVVIGRTDGAYAPGMLRCLSPDGLSQFASFDTDYGVQNGMRRIVCSLPVGAGANLTVFVSVGNLAGNVTSAYSYGQPAISAVYISGGVVLPSPSTQPTPSASESPVATISASPSASVTPSASGTSSPAAAAASPSGSGTPAPEPSPDPSPTPAGGRRLQFSTSNTPSTSPEATPSGSASPAVSPTPIPAAMLIPRPAARLGGVLTVEGFPADAGGAVVVTVLGSNFGRLDNASNCLFFAWYGRTDRTLVCDGMVTAVGEGEVPYVAILDWTHDRIAFTLPPGAGLREIVPVVFGQAPTAPLVAQYAAPIITGDLSPRLGDTEGGTAVTITGTNFGRAPLQVDDREDRDSELNVPLPETLQAWLDAQTLPQEIMRVHFARMCFSRYNDSLGFRPPPVADCGDAIDSHSNNAIVFRNPPGIGVNRSVYVSIVDRLPNGSYVEFASAARNFSYLPPVVLNVQPRPIPMDGTGGKWVTLEGQNFGRENPAWSPEELAVDVRIGLWECSDEGRFENARTGDIYLRCTAPNMPVGPKNLTYTVAGQTGFNEDYWGIRSAFTACQPASPKTFSAKKVSAKDGFYGKDGEWCYPCPRGAFCGGFDDGVTIADGGISVRDGGVHTYPRPLMEWYNLNSTDLLTSGMTAACPSKMKVVDREKTAAAGGVEVLRDVCVVPCEPKEACAGDNYCAYGYVSEAPYFRCATCAAGFYKRANECVRCPDSPAALFVGAAFLLATGAGVAYVLNKKKINIGYISIGVDFFQVLALFANSKVKWPPAIKELFHILSAFNLNIEIVAPECLVPKLAYTNKWYFVMVLPIGIMGVFLLVHAYYTFYKSAIKGRKKGLNSHAGQLVSSITMLMYIMYIYLTRTVLDVFNCAPTDPDDGNQYLTVVFEKCGVPGGTQLTLLPLAVIALIVYVIGYPAFVAFTLYRNRELIMEDQLLRAKGVGNDRLSNPRAYEMRKRFRNLYYQFKPDYIYWAMAIIFRKFLLACTLIMFNRNSSFQLAAALLIMFLAYAAHVKVTPYMSPGSYELSLKDHERFAEEGSPIHVKLRTSIGKIESRGRKRVHKNLMSADGKVDKNAVLGMLGNWLFDYNTTEALLLFACVIVALMGLMFASLPERDNSKAVVESRDAITSVAMAVILLGVLYFFFVVIGEITILYTEDQRRKALEKKAAAARKKGNYGNASSKQENKRKDLAAAAAMMTPGDAAALTGGPVEASMNPLFLEGGGQAASGITEAIVAQQDIPSQELWRLFQSSFISIQDDISRTSHNVAECKVAQQKLEAAAALLAESAGPSGGRISESSRPVSMRAKKKQGFEPSQAAASSRALVSSRSGGGGGGDDEDGPGTPKLGGRPGMQRQASMAARPASLQSLKGLKK